MDHKRWQEVEALLDRALDAGPDHWEAVLADGSAGDDSLREEVRALLAKHEQIPEFLARGAGALLEHTSTDIQDPVTGSVFGPWRVMEEIGRGGMSRVFRGERADASYERSVAIKILRLGLDTPADAARFRQERQILAGLDHPNIARLLDGGTTPDGRPYLVLDLVHGVPIDQWARRPGVTVWDRVSMIVLVARAVAHAHRQLIVHRDIKPANILVTADDSPRLLDFGIATLVDPSGSVRTATRQRWHSPGYAAPEQVRGEATTTATDVYQLGVVLFELCTGQRPLGGDARAYEAAVLRDEPLRPSALVPALAGDLDAILLKALRKEPGARYASVADFADDLERARRHEPVAARSGDRSYRAQRFLRRHSTPILAGAAAVTALAVYAATVQRQNVRIAAALAESDRQRMKSDEVTEFLVTLFRSTDPSSGSADSVSARTLLARGEALARDTTRRESAQWAMLQVLGRIREDLGATEAARANYAAALALAARSGTSSDVELAGLVSQLANAHFHLRHVDSAEVLFRQALDVQRRTLGDSAIETRGTMVMLGTTLHALQRGDESEQLFAEWERLMARDSGMADRRLASQLALMADHLGWLSNDTTVLARAERYARESLRMYRALYGPRSADAADALEQVATIVYRAGRTSEGLRLATEAFEQHAALFPDGHPRLASNLMSLGTMHRDVGRDSAAVEYYRRGLEMTVKLKPDDVFLIAGNRHLYGDGLRRIGRHDEAIRELVRAEAEFRARVSPGSVIPRNVRVDLGLAYQAARRYPEAERALRSAYDELRERRPAQDRYVVRALRALLAFYEHAGRTKDIVRYRAVLAASTTPSPTPAMTAPAKPLPP